MFGKISAMVSSNVFLPPSPPSRFSRSQMTRVGPLSIIQQATEALFDVLSLLATVRPLQRSPIPRGPKGKPCSPTFPRTRGIREHEASGWLHPAQEAWPWDRHQRLPKATKVAVLHHVQHGSQMAPGAPLPWEESCKSHTDNSHHTETIG